MDGLIQLFYKMSKTSIMRQKIYKIIEFVPNHVLYDLFTM